MKTGGFRTPRVLPPGSECERQNAKKARESGVSHFSENINFCRLDYQGGIVYHCAMETKAKYTKKRRRAAKKAVRTALALLLAAIVTLGGIFAARAIHEARLRAEYVPLTPDEIDIARLKGEAAETDPARLSVARSALSLVGKVHYFWGGKSYSIGPDPKWGEMTEVESGGSSTTGEMRPYGLDCSGFVAWCFLQQGLTNEELESQVGLGTWAQWENSEEISWKELRVGDIVFQNSYPTNKGNHVGVCIGFNEKGKPVFAHCALGFDNVVVTPAGDVFRYARRPKFFS